MVFQMLHQLIELFFCAVALCIYLHLIGDSLGSARLNVGQIHMFLLETNSKQNITLVSFSLS